MKGIIEEKIEVTKNSIEGVEKYISFLEFERENYPSNEYRIKRNAAIDQRRALRDQLKEQYLQALNECWENCKNTDLPFQQQCVYHLTQLSYDLGVYGWAFRVNGWGEESRLVWEEQER